MVEANAFAFSKTIIEYLAWGVEFAAALIIAIAAARATWQSLRLFAAGDHCRRRSLCGSREGVGRP